ncbi:MAG: type IV secretory system conjugative DNA transfer family protein, partial [bacterium]|nr:type IV secretory system conjugative DNA transfer family protein [bacterium]
EEAITANCHLRVAFTANKPETAQLISRMVGDMTVHHEQRSYRAGSRPSVSQQQTRRPLLTPDETMRLPEDDALVFVAGQAPVRATKIRYFEDAELQRRAGVPAPGVSDVVN